MGKKLHALAIGEVLWDVVDGTYHLGGAPFNVAAHLVKMGNHAAMYSAVGRDDLGDKILDRMKEIGVDAGFVSRHETRPTSMVSVFLQEGQPDYTIHEDVAWDDLAVDADILSSLHNQTWDVAIFGLLSQREDKNARNVRKIIEATRAPHVFLDVNIRKHYYTAEKLERSMQIASIVKLNEDELSLIRDLFYPGEGELRFAAEKIASRFELDILIVTLGGKGAWAYGQKRWFKAAAEPVVVADAIGAGDSFSAAFLHAWLGGKGIQEALELAVAVGAFVASQSGAIPEYTGELSELISSV